MTRRSRSSSRRIAGKLDWKAKRAEKLAPVKLNALEQMMAFTSSMAVVGGKAGPNYPAPMLAIRSMQESATKGRDEALADRGEVLRQGRGHAAGHRAGRACSSPTRP